LSGARSFLRPKTSVSHGFAHISPETVSRLQQPGFAPQWIYDNANIQCEIPLCGVAKRAKSGSFSDTTS
jgi:hypothetical protein